jgi:hypothetical protein
MNAISLAIALTAISFAVLVVLYYFWRNLVRTRPDTVSVITRSDGSVICRAHGVFIKRSSDRVRKVNLGRQRATFKGDFYAQDASFSIEGVAIFIVRDKNPTALRNAARLDNPSEHIKELLEKAIREKIPHQSFWEVLGTLKVIGGQIERELKDALTDTGYFIERVDIKAVPDAKIVEAINAKSASELGLVMARNLELAERTKTVGAAQAVGEAIDTLCRTAGISRGEAFTVFRDRELHRTFVQIAANGGNTFVVNMSPPQSPLGLDTRLQDNPGTGLQVRRFTKPGLPPE